MKASIIISTHNNIKDLPGLLASIAGQVLNGHEMEVIIRDDGSTDGSVQWIGIHYPQYALLHGENIGFSKSNNIASLHATGDIFVFINADTLIDRKFVVSGLRQFEIDNMIGGLNTNMIMPWILKIRSFVEGERPMFGFGYFLNTFGFAEYKKILPVPREVSFLTGGAGFIRRNALYGNAPFSEKLLGRTSYCEDLDLSLRLIANGWRICYAPDAIVYHNQGRDTGPVLKQLKKFSQVSLNRITVYADNLSFSCFLRFLPRLFLSLPKKIETLQFSSIKRKISVFVATAMAPLFLLVLPYWILRNKAQAGNRCQIKTLSFLKDIVK